MSSYVITGASRGIGFGFVSSLSSNPNNIVIGFVRNVEAAQAKVAKELPDRSNVHIIRGDLDDYQSLEDAFEATSKITGGILDYLIANGAATPANMDSLTELGKQHLALDKEAVDTFRTNVVGNINLFNLALPLLEKGGAKKVVVLTSGLGDVQFTVDSGVFEVPSYSISKAALDLVVAKYHAEYKNQGILFMGISPGVVDTQVLGSSDLPPEAQAKIGAFFTKFNKYAPHFTGPDSVGTSVKNVLTVVDGATIENNGGRAVSHLGNRNWL